MSDFEALYLVLVIIQIIAPMVYDYIKSMKK